MNLDFSKGLVPAVVIDDATEQVLMVAYMNEEAYQKTLDTRESWFYSRSRDELWHKGGTSGHTQKVKAIQVDCDEDTILLRVTPNGPACHTGETTCFYREIDLDTKEIVDAEPRLSIYKQLFEEIEDRKQNRVENSYTNYLFDKGIDKIGKKVIEEAGEVVIAAKNSDREEIVKEVADLFYHSFVLMANQEVSLAQVELELESRTHKKGNSKGDRQEIEKW
ncbi:bifunctional phosphoribosyl-AMP cyclohydrolase/phosphoribosyl-ATP diphosphatase HisIE [Radiobacillus deserti]|uniref:Histidine biosynthesis bifunctional protein HisIE n=1 Tax=Radiobacillus deserti TaxID=2594883 RepID=A0A516KFZ0_9BACI|nr:bifunctional phosphoribosyl-AMP cyclohydrolase/phosphoribosyl-ATP diphosphatase HisIE [Radiobacillus deserti]QDP40317.1 bifunctional phosphoribosyl-AMP cyclohydrolase/phosphoribosyl-ATP diphosphatase HisIE [Radiobacillus deserti]